jgi:hypothetical protein
VEEEEILRFESSVKKHRVTKQGGPSFNLREKKILHSIADTSVKPTTNHQLPPSESLITVVL